MLAAARVFLVKATGVSAIVHPPKARISPTTLETHGHVRVDSYHWLRERDKPEVVDYLRTENDYTAAVMRHTEGLQTALFEEIKGRIKQTDMSVPYREGDYYYYTRFEAGKEYPIYCRKRGSPILDGLEQVILDVNVMATGYEFYAVESRVVSSAQDILAYAADTVGRRISTIQFKNLETGEVLPDVIPDVTSNIAWANDNRTLFYAKQDPTTLRPFQIYRHRLGTSVSDDQLVYEEADETFGVAVFKTKSKKYLMVASFQTLSTEYRFLEADDPTGTFTVFLPREREHEYHVDHRDNTFYVRTNLDAKNFRLMETLVGQTGTKHWREVVPHRNDVLLAGIEMFKDYLVLQERKDGLTQIRIRPWSGQGEHALEFAEPAYQAAVSANPEMDTQILRYGYTSMTTPNSIYDYDMASRTQVLLKQEEVLGGFDARNYQTERVHARAHDGTKIPISIVYRTGLKKDGTSPLLLYGYGAYGFSLDATFSSPRLSLIDRGFIYAIAHVRGGQELGRSWYEDGKLLKKKNTFTDFIACAEHLVRERYTSPDHLFAMGGSAGGLLIGAVLNMRPDLFAGVVALVPFVDVVTTMLGDSVPLTTSEYDEWGNPNEKAFFEYIRSYSPYDNVEAKPYPHILVTAGLHDSQVQYWEPAQWVAKLRATKTDQHRLLLKTNMDAGHGGASGRHQRYRETALHYAFLLDLAGVHVG